MLRLRRYRVYAILAVFIVGALYHFKILRDSAIGDTNSVGGLRNFAIHHEHEKTPAAQTPSEEIVSGHSKYVPQQKEVKKQGSDEKNGQGKLDESPPATFDHAPLPKPIIPSPSISQPEEGLESAAHPGKDDGLKDAADSKVDALPTKSAFPSIVDDLEKPGKGRLETPMDPLLPKIYWSKLPEHFPIPSARIIQLPTGSPKQIPQIQYTFADESPNDKISREQKLGRIKKTFEFSWAGYKEKAWMQDELSPVSGAFRNPFCGWAATLVDSLDTLWLMGMKEEFEEAANAVKDIDFTTSVRRDIPLFETVIRYLGGLLAAYDLSGGKYRVFLEKAIELAEVLMGAFDTPNRMPMTYYFWKPAFASQPHRARTRTVLAELGSLSLEFTRLAQLTKEPKYYDAIARISNELAAWQNNTKLPGLWPMQVDASGCKKPDVSPTLNLPELSSDDSGNDISSPGSKVMSESKRTENAHVDSEDNEPEKDSRLAKSSMEHSESVTTLGGKATKNLSSANDSLHPNVGNVKRQLDQAEITKGSTPLKADIDELPSCEPQGLASPPSSLSEEFSIGGQADSVYEYLPKEYMLLGGLEDVYRRMYEMAVETTKKYLLFRPMLPEGRNILLSGVLRTSGRLDDAGDLSLKPEGTHLTCFAGGMFAIGAKIYNRESDIDIARKLTDGCVWAYEATMTGIMPERYLAVPCQNQERCDWNETLYNQMVHATSGTGNTHLKGSQQAVLNGKNSEPNQKAVNDSHQFQQADGPKERRNGLDAEKAEPKVPGGPEANEDRVSKRQMVDLENRKPLKPGSESIGTQIEKEIPSMTNVVESEHEKTGNSEGSITDVEQNSKKKDASEDGAGETKSSQPTPTPQQSSKASIIDERLPIGMTKVTSPVYILRPEAIESIFIMYRITGDSYWREKGWVMFEAITKHTASKYGASGIKDVTSQTPGHTDMMESFWLAETLKYFYLLFSDPGLISLDDYVLFFDHACACDDIFRRCRRKDEYLHAPYVSSELPGSAAKDIITAATGVISLTF